MRDNPNHIAVWGDDPEYRVQALTGFMGATLPLAAQPVVAVRDGQRRRRVRHRPAGRVHRRHLPLARRRGAAVQRGRGRAGPHRRVARPPGPARDLEEPHWHLGPLAADLPLQRQGIGTVLMDRFCATVDAAGDAAYLETDKAENVGYYERFGFETVGEADVLGVRNWFMRRRAR